MADVLRSAITNPAYHDIFAIIKGTASLLSGARNGLVYGAKVRFPHALIMAILFGRGSYRDRARTIFKATRQHAFNLAKFVSVYKTALLVQKTLAGGKQRKADTFFAGLLGGWCIFGERNAINEQIVLYVVSRVITSFLPRATPPQAPKLPPGGLSAATSAAGVPPPPGFPYARPRPPNSKVFEVYAALSWGAVMWLFAERRDTLQSGMINSMQYLYLDSEVWSPLRPLKTLFWHNR
ncbi:BZ3500_MvSof-1268-A1-R1_Chr6-2g08487 [Microbotryum saponariae]|uniref:BZ3500_MvSof-1268-A1-R1_Chr6-2g08487 protein n=1 Tax=Microbotryum saponariae TaxID=289078 RepID=A0A2X0KHS4_9BASI|nr:BZ3500_MvSof-1268-A1-R1_Chr6-2g08487 [Microbotryum saponariae]SDA07764.1 BZ3501_MvSof-1269-A2-R1_Chr6-1g08201 [Microbotryum saponariae]